MAISFLSLLGLPGSPPATPFADRTPANYPEMGILVEEFDIWRPGYNAPTVYVYRAGTTTLAPLYSDIFLTQPLQNPQVLITQEDNAGVIYSKFAQSVYTPFNYELDINNVEQTGIQRVPITNLAGKDASLATSKVDGSLVARTLQDRFSDTIHAEDFGELGDSPETNTETLTAAISAAALQGGGIVYLPAGSIPFTQLSLPGDVVLVGQGRDVTTLESRVAGKVITIAGADAGLRTLTLDGVLLLSGSIGIDNTNNFYLGMEDVLVKRFEDGIKFIGGQNINFRNVSVRNCTRNVVCYGDSDINCSGNGGEVAGIHWVGGDISQSTEYGLDFSVVDLPVRHHHFEQVEFLDNAGVAVNVYGASFIRLGMCYWDGNITNLQVADNPDVTLEDRTVVGLYIEGGQMQEGVNKFDGHCQDVIFDQVELNGVEMQLNVPENQILVRDCVENDMLITGDTTKLSRWRTIDQGTIKGVTTDATATVVWATEVFPGEAIAVDVKASAQQLNGNEYAAYMEAAGFYCQGSTLNYDAQTANFTVGSQIQGQTSGATAIIQVDSDSGTTGTLRLTQISGDFVNDEIISEVDGTGSARANGTLTRASASLMDTVSLMEVGSNAGALPTGWGSLGFQVSGQQAQVTVTGKAATEIQWNVKVDMTVL